MKNGKYIEVNKGFLAIVLHMDLLIRKSLIPVLFFVGVISYFYGIAYPLFQLGILFLIYFFASEIGFWTIKKGNASAENAYFFILFVDCILLSAGIYYSGGIESFLPAVFCVIGVLAGLTLPLPGLLGIIFTALICYFTEIALETFRLIPHVSVFKEFFSQEQYIRSAYLRIVPLMDSVIFIVLTTISYSVSNLLRNREKHLAALNDDLNKSAELLVRRDTELISLNRELDKNVRELEELKANLEKKVKERTQEMETANEKLKELDKMKSNFLSNISHELRTPLSMIKGFASTILQEKDIDPKNLREFLQIIDEESGRLNDLITRLLNLSRIEVGGIRINKNDFDLSAAAREVMDTYKSFCAIKKLTLEGDMPERFQIFADQQYFKEAFSHLLENAIQYTNGGGMIKVVIRENDNEAVISVSDTGCGIPKDELPHIFERFYKVERPAEKVGGIGLGLAMVKYIIEAQGGKIWVESPPACLPVGKAGRAGEAGKGTRFAFSLPKVVQ